MSELEAGLVRCLRRPVAAPPDLWNRIQERRLAGGSRAVTGWVLWPAVAAVALISFVDLGWQMSRARSVTAAPRLAAIRFPENRRAECLSCHIQGL